jgi:hypothetical protein
VVDTRTGLGVNVFSKHEGPLGPGDGIVFNPYKSAVPGALSSDQAVGAYVLNVTAAGPTDKSFLTVFPFGESLPDASNLNTVPGENVPNAVVVRPGIAGLEVIRNNAGYTHVIVDIVGIVPRQNARDAVDDAGGSRFHVVYLLGADSVEDTSMPDKIRSELEAANAWMVHETGAGLDFGRRNGVIDVTTWRMTGFTQDQLLHWETVQRLIGGYIFYEPILQLLDDGFGFPVDQRVLVYINGTRADGPCGETWGQYATLFTGHTLCNVTVDGFVGDPTTVGNGPNTELIALHEVLHALGAVPSCGTRSNGDSHSTAIGDLMFPGLYPDFPKHIDAARDTYFGDNIAGCPDIARSPFLTTVPG